MPLELYEQVFGIFGTLWFIAAFALAFYELYNI